MEVVRELPLDQVMLGDCVQLMRMLPPASVHCVFADPPYNLQLRGELRRPDDSLVEYVELPAEVHPYYVSTQAHPELRSRPTRPHPLFAGLIGAAITRQRELRIPIDETGLRRHTDDE